MKAVSQTGSRRSVPPVQLSQPPGTILTNGREAPLAARSPRPTAPADCTEDVFCRLVPFGQFGRGQRHKSLFTPFALAWARESLCFAGGLSCYVTNRSGSSEHCTCCRNLVLLTLPGGW